MTKPLILITNDDGLFAPGIKALLEVVQEVGTPIIVAPDSPQSGKGHAISIHEPLRLKKVDTFEGVEAYECSGTPVDCVKLARNVVLKGRVPDLCVSGINHGSNVAINILYSGTMSAAMEASLEGMDSIGFSLLDFTFEANFEPGKPYIKEIIEYTLKNGLSDHSKLLNVNIPNLPANELKGIRVCRQANAGWKEDFLENKDPLDRPYYWMSGEFVNNDKGEDSDVWALQNGYISVVPCQHDLTAYKAMSAIRGLERITG